MIIDWYDKVSVRAAKLFCRQDGTITVGITSGCFDVLHELHIHFLQRCKKMCDVLIVGVDSDKLVQKVKGPDRPIHNERTRLFMLNELRCVDMVFIMDTVSQFGKACDTFIHKKEYGVVFKNQEWEGHEGEIDTGLSSPRIIIVPDIKEPAMSTSDIITKIKELEGQDES
jgi:D-beta-D-heptose 7-phosphate kinase / D-beta-D-heptose 1-phosphate adenosyltransferase